MNILSFSKKQGLITGIFIIFLYLLPYIVFGENSYITIHDFLDSSIAHIKAVIDNNALLDENKIIPILSGLPRSLFFSIFDIKIIPFLFLSPYWAIVVNTFLIKITAFLGLFLLLDKHILKEGEYKNIINFSTSICFALIPFYVDYGISSAGIPLVIYALLNLHKEINLLNSYLIIIYFSFYSSLVLSGIFLCFSAFIYYLYIRVANRKIYKHYILGLLLMSFIYLFLNVDLFISFFISNNFISHRTEFSPTITLKSAIIDVYNIIRNSQYHAGSFWATPIIICCLYIITFLKTDKRMLYTYSIWLLYIIAFISLANFAKYFFSQTTIIRTFQFDRFYFLYPTICFIILGISLQILFIKRLKLIGLILLLITLVTTLKRDQETIYFVKSISSIENKNKSIQPSYKQFYDENLFNIIEQEISPLKRSDYQVVCVGMFPSILEYNGYKTIDSYFYNYPLSFKHKFSTIIKKELEKSPNLKSYFYNWGSRCYIFSSELGTDYLWGKERNGKINNLDIDTDKLREMECSYIFSAVSIQNYENLNLSYIGEYTTSDSFWNIYVYKL